METTIETKTRVYKFGNKSVDGSSKMKKFLGGKGANLAEISGIGNPVPSGFTITTEVCTEYNTLGKEKVFKTIKERGDSAIESIESTMGAKFRKNKGNRDIGFSETLNV